MIRLKIAELYPDRIVPCAIYDRDSSKWSSALIELFEDGTLGDTVFAHQGYIFDTEDDALFKIRDTLKVTMETIKIMSN
jgi:hypothetical protein